MGVGKNVRPIDSEVREIEQTARLLSRSLGDLPRRGGL